LQEGEERFSKLLHGRPEAKERHSKSAEDRDEQSDSEADGGDGREPQSPAQLLAGDRILRGLLPADQPPAPADGPTPLDSGRVGEIADKLAQRILVSDADRGEPGEVRIHLRDSVMAGAEITLSRQQGMLVVNLVVPDTDLAARLQPHADTLERTLAQRLDTQVQIRIQGSDPGTGQPHDGRSRNRGDPWNDQNTED
jgi:type III secretion system needle length determinant